MTWHLKDMDGDMPGMDMPDGGMTMQMNMGTVSLRARNNTSFLRLNILYTAISIIVLLIYFLLNFFLISSAVMTFGSFRDYKLQLLWDSWNITQEWQFILSWIAVFLAVVLYHGLHYVIFALEVSSCCLHETVFIAISFLTRFCPGCDEKTI